MSGVDMSQSKDPAIKLFGRKIPLVAETQIPSNPESKYNCIEVVGVKTGVPNHNNPGKPDKSTLAHGKEKVQNPIQVNGSQIISKPKEYEAEINSDDQEKVFKKPDKVLPCPRCNSLETKFCYFNNYNVNQPRHFCKNCQRYWTAGGTMRNVPIGAGRRKNKHLTSQYRQILLSSDGIPIAEMENSDSANRQLISSVESATLLRPSPSPGNGVVLKFGPEAPLCESMETVLNIGDQKRYAEMSSINCRDNGEEPSLCGSSMAASNVLGNEPENVVQNDKVGLPGSSNELSTPHPMHCYPVSPWVVPWNPVWNNVASMAATQYSSGQACITNGNNPNQVQWCPTPMVAVPGFGPPSIPLQFIPASYWGCMPMWAAGTGNVPLSGSNGCLSPSSSTSTNRCSGNGSPTLGKHSRDSIMDEEKAEKCILVPKTLRIDDPSDASKIHLWAALGLKPDQKDHTSKGSIFNTFETKAEGKAHVSDSTHILEANPAARSRSRTFQESS